MALNKQKTLKKYYGIGEVARMFGVADTLLRYWEREFPSLRPRTTPSGVRQYTQEDIDEIGLIYNLLKERGMRISAARDMLAHNRGKARRTRTALERLEAIRAELVAIRKELDHAAI